jgi:hypothetical protein
MNHGTSEAHFPLTLKVEERPYIPLIVLYGDQDKVAHPRNSDELMRINCVAGTSESAPRATAEIAHAEGVYGHTRNLFNDDAGEAVGEQWMVHGLGHTWSGGDSAGTYTDGNGANASGEMLGFFSAVEAGKVGTAMFPSLADACSSRAPHCSVNVGP